MRIETAHVHVPARADRVFDYVSRVGNLPEWATEFIRDSELELDALRAQTAAGDVVLRTRAHREAGVVDILVTAGTEEPAVFPTRVFPLPDGSSVFAFTLVQGPDQPEQRFESELASLRRDLENIRRKFAG